MIETTTIGDFTFIAQTTYTMYVTGNDKPILITSDIDIFNEYKKLAEEGKIKARNKK
jgi:hypothetical protein